MPIAEFKATCLAALEHVRRTRKPILITKRGKPVAQIDPPPLEVTSWSGIMKGSIEILGDIVEPLPAKDWAASAR